MKGRLASVLLLFVLAAGRPAFGQAPFAGAADIDAAIQQAIADDEIPGAVVIIGQPGRVLYRNVFGQRALLPEREPMTEDTIFDVASLTKVVSTASAMMKL